MPTELNIPDKTVGDAGMRYINGDRTALDGMNAEMREEALDLGQKYIDNIARYGYKTWYGWRRAYWGTKWNAYDCEVSGDAVTFNTAWNAPLPIYRALGKMFPHAEFEVVFADEDVGANTGHIIIKDGTTFCSLPDDGSDEAYALFIQTHPGAEDWLYKDGTTGEWQISED